VWNDPVNYYDPDGRNPFAIAGAIIGGGLNAYNNYNAYSSGQMSGMDYAKSITFGAGTGALAGFAPGILGGALMGGAMSGANDAYDQSLRCDGNVDWGKSGIAALKGLGAGALGAGALGAGALGGLGAKIGSHFYTPVSQIGKSVSRGGDGTIRDFGNIGGITGAAVGSLGTNSW
jgi:hypothetical protein